jgi:3D (Asp-Asp-Asp) domain-containing protein
MESILTLALVAFFVMPNASAAASSTPITVLASAYNLTMTAYNAVPDQTDADPTVTASGAYADPNVVAARSIDLADELPFGTVIAIEPAATSSPTCGDSLVHPMIGLRVIADSMHPSRHQQVDILFDTDQSVIVGGKSVSAARAMGVCNNMKVVVVGHVNINKMPRTQAELAARIGIASLAIKN